LFSFLRWTLMKVRMPRYELAPLTIAKMENNRTERVNDFETAQCGI
jgi:hypothetical protein